MAKYSKWVGKKISKIMHEGIRGRKVGQKQAIAVALNMAREKGRKVPRRAGHGRRGDGALGYMHAPHFTRP